MQSGRCVVSFPMEDGPRGGQHTRTLAVGNQRLYVVVLLKYRVF